MIDVKKLASVPLNDLQGLPVYSGVYLAIDNALRVWYVGSSINLRQRLLTHDKLEDFKENNVTKIAFLPSENYQEDESKLINQFDPPLNSLNDFKKYHLPHVPVDNLSPQQCFDRYCEVKELLKMLEDEAELLKPNVVSFIENNSEDGTKYVGKNVRAWLTSRPTYQHTEAVAKLEKQVKELKKKEIDEGVAKVIKTSTYPTIKFI